MKVNVEYDYIAHKKVSLEVPKNSKFEKYCELLQKNITERTDEEWDFVEDYCLEDFISVYTGEDRENIYDANFID